ncbi:PPOX class F420-dependent oxidoreductase [Lipingzhangella sp. LS1_29]|uniref:PPOX class F420-dependent oxidoreductase n=1 Tax=Lipingzhangella rawalii TaxID=2055835 RepID=A0ABU2H2Y9_9ACTN|nr:PPOX class F420-dependent oxidoreductase [Lipingzhangella rawalii]MDS1269661.1 PPOX class F420-dependent oxidoreductase [Lipingzhangella rawalii]
MSVATLFQPLRQHKLAMLTTYHPDGVTSVDDLTRIALDNDRVLLAVAEDAGAAARLDGHPLADLTPCSADGTRTGAPIRVEATRLRGTEAERAARLLTVKFPVQQRLGPPLSSRLLRRRTVYFELRPHTEQAPAECAEGWPD